MRRNRQRRRVGLEFGGSGEDSFVAVVVTKLTGALLFILLLTMVIMALLPKAVDLAPPGGDDVRAGAETPPAPLAITTPESLPEAIAGRPYTVALAARGGRGPLRWTLGGTLAGGTELRLRLGRLAGNPEQGNARAALAVGPGQRRHRAGHRIDPAAGLPERQPAGHSRLVETRNSAGALESLAGPGGRIPRPLAGSSRGHERAGQSRTLQRRRDTRSRAGRCGGSGRPPAVCHLPHPLPPEHLPGDACPGRLALGGTVGRPDTRLSLDSAMAAEKIFRNVRNLVGPLPARKPL